MPKRLASVNSVNGFSDIRHWMSRVKSLFDQHKQRYGAERLQRKMPKPYDLKTIAVTLKRKGLIAKAGRKFKAITT